jgi:hypothetical protein
MNTKVNKAHYLRYFKYIAICMCGIPSITIEGTKSDWQSILERIAKISEFGTEPAKWANMLQVIITRFVRAFDQGGPQADMEFWQRIAHEESGSGGYFISGWISTFCAWDTSGTFFSSRPHQRNSFGYAPDWVHRLTFDGIWFPRVRSPPEGYAEVDVLVKDVPTDKVFDCTMLAGHVGIAIEGKEQLDTIRIAPQWFMYVKGQERTPGTQFWRLQ